MVYGFGAETILCTLAAVGLAALVREAWLWLFRRPGGECAVSVTLSAAPAAEEYDYILNACEEIRRYYFPGLTVHLSDGNEEKTHAEGTDHNRRDGTVAHL